MTLIFAASARLYTINRAKAGVDTGLSPILYVGRSVDLSVLWVNCGKWLIWILDLDAVWGSEWGRSTGRGTGVLVRARDRPRGRGDFGSELEASHCNYNGDFVA